MPNNPAEPPAERSYRLAILAESPIPYHVCLYRSLAAHPNLDVTVFFLSDLGLSGRKDAGFGIRLYWGLPLLTGFRYRFVPNFSLHRTNGAFFSLINPGVLTLLFQKRYDAVLIPGYAYASYVMGFLSAWISKTPILFRGETVLRPGSLRGWKGWAKKRLLRAVRTRGAFLAIGNSSRRFYRALGAPEDRTFFSPYAVDNDFFERECRRWRPRRAEEKRRLGVDPGLPVVLFCGKLTPRKRPDDLLEAFLGLKHPAALVFAGEGSLHHQLARRASGNKNVLLAGFVLHSDIPKYYALADIFVLPSTEAEGSPLTINEAMACGLPLIVSEAIPSAPEFVREGENGFLFRLGDVHSLRALLDLLLADEGLRKRLGEESFRKIQAWSLRESVAGILKALQRTASLCE